MTGTIPAFVLEGLKNIAASAIFICHIFIDKNENKFA
jgi:hypothetical protein